METMELLEVDVRTLLHVNGALSSFVLIVDA